MPGPDIARKIRRAGMWETAADSVTLDYDSRFLRRRRLVTDHGAALHVDLAETTSLADGDALECLDGRLIAVRAAPEPLLEVRGDALGLARLAWHIGNRHTPAEIRAGCIRLRRDHVMADMLARLGAEVSEVAAPFAPEGGAYGQGRTHGHDHGHDHGHAHDHDHHHHRDPQDHAPGGADTTRTGHRA